MKNIKIRTLVFLLLWIVIYFNLETIVNFAFTSFNLSRTSHFVEAAWFFVFEVPKVLLLLSLIVFCVGIIRSYFPPERTRQFLEGKPLFLGNILASLLGIVTPFCSCSAIPLFLGFVEAGIPLGVTFSFLIAAPMINEVAVVLLFGMFGFKTAFVYVATGLLIAIFSGWIIGKLNLTRFLEDWVVNMKQNGREVIFEKLSFEKRLKLGYENVADIVKKVWIYIVIGIAVGAGVHGYVPENFMASIMGKNNWYAVPLSVLIGIPMYSNAAGIIPVIQALYSKGAALGTVLAFMMSVIALSLPEMIILKKVMKIQLLVIFAGVVGTGILVVGYLFNMIF